LPYLVLYVLNKEHLLPEVLQAWEKAGAPGITILHTAGAAQLRHHLPEDLPLLPSLGDLLAGDENVHNVTLISIVPNETTVDQIVEATQALVGDFTQHNSGVLCVLPVLRAYGLDKPR
jgi:nitrogen regulatory protein PII